MDITIENIANIDFTDVADLTKERLKVTHPGVFLQETLQQLGVSQADFARAIGVSPMRISHVIRGVRPVSAELALLFGCAFKQTPQYWLNLQSAFDLSQAEQRLGTYLDDVRVLGKL